MLRSNGYCGKVRASHCLSLSHCSVNAKTTRRGTRHVFALPFFNSRFNLSSRKVKSNIKDLSSGCGFSSFALLDALSRFDQKHDCSPAANRTKFIVGGGCNGWRMDQTKKAAGAVWVKMLGSWAATGTTVQMPVHVARTGTTIHRTRTTTSGLAACVTTSSNRFVNAFALQADLSKCGQPVLSSLGKYAQRSRITSSRKSKDGASIQMPKRYRHLIDQIADIDNLRIAYQNTARSKRMTHGFLEFKEYNESNLLLIQKELLDGNYKIGRYRDFIIYEPKPRLISALDFKDRLVQHALCNVIGPIFEKAMLPQTFACRVGLGTHAGVKYLQAEMRRTQATHFLKTDFSKYFPSVDHEILHQMIDRKIGCERTLKILREIIPAKGKGIPIGSLTSQLFANVYGNEVDRFVHFDLGFRSWARYMDDIVVLGWSLSGLRSVFLEIQQFASQRLGLKISKWHSSSVSSGINFLGYRIWPTHKLLRKDSVIKAKHKVSKFIRHDDQESLRKFIASWSGHAAWADTHNLFNWMEKRHGIICH